MKDINMAGKAEPGMDRETTALWLHPPKRTRFEADLSVVCNEYEIFTRMKWMPKNYEKYDDFSKRQRDRFWKKFVKMNLKYKKKAESFRETW